MATKAQIQAEENYRKLQAKWDKMYGPITSKARRPAAMPVLVAPPGRESSARLPSRVTPGGSAVVRIANVYSGVNMLGTAVLHKSNTVPVFSQQEIQQIGAMRR